jgi:hypothetical protein
MANLERLLARRSGSSGFAGFGQLPAINVVIWRRVWLAPWTTV